MLGKDIGLIRSPSPPSTICEGNNAIEEFAKLSGSPLQMR